jgi:hypothetical protein
MATITIPWADGFGNIVITYTTGTGNDSITVESSTLPIAPREQTVSVSTTAGSPQRTVYLTVEQQAVGQGPIIIQ